MGEVSTFQHDQAKSKDSSRLNASMREIFDALDTNRAEILKKVHAYENEASAPDKPYTDEKPGRLSFYVDNPNKLSIYFEGGLWHGQEIKVEFLEDSGESGGLKLRTTMTMEEQASAGKLLDAVNEILQEQGYTVER